VCVKEVVEFVGEGREVGVEMMWCVHGVYKGFECIEKRGGERSVREEYVYRK
jgi:hypothetical protein